MMFGRTPKEKEERRRLPLWYRAVSFSVTLLAVAAVCFCGVLAIIARIGEEGKSVFGTVILRVESESMEPTFLAGDVLAFSEYDGGELSEGDIVVFRAPYGVYEGLLITHRIVGVAEKDGEAVYTTRGDAAQNPDTWELGGEDIVGVFEKKLPLVTDVAGYISSAAGSMLVIGLPVLLLIGVLLADSLLSKQLEKRAEEGSGTHGDGPAND